MNEDIKKALQFGYVMGRRDEKELVLPPKLGLELAEMEFKEKWMK